MGSTAGAPSDLVAAARIGVGVAGGGLAVGGVVAAALAGRAWRAVGVERAVGDVVLGGGQDAPGVHVEAGHHVHRRRRGIHRQQMRLAPHKHHQQHDNPRLSTP